MDIRFGEDKGFQELLEDKIKTFNNQTSPYHKKVRGDREIEYIQIEERQNDEFLGGLTARIYWRCMYIDDFYVESSCRGQGLGREILSKAIEVAEDRQCRFIVLTTYSFQAKDFYEKYGFHIIGEIKDYPPGSSYYTMRKDLI